MIQVNVENFLQSKGNSPGGFGQWAFMSEDGRWGFSLWAEYNTAKRRAKTDYGRTFRTSYGIIILEV